MEEPKFDEQVSHRAHSGPLLPIAPTGMEQWRSDLAREIRAAMSSGDHWDELAENERVPWLHFADRVTKGLIRRGYLVP
jgi:hypothetical protein